MTQQTLDRLGNECSYENKHIEATEVLKLLKMSAGVQTPSAG